jgi:chromate transporter
MKEIIGVFLKLGCIAFGGPAAHIAMMQEEIVEKRKWLSQEKFLSYIGLTQLIPGPNSTELVLHCGYERGGYKGLLLAGLSFLAPALLSTLLLAYVYVHYGTIPNVSMVFMSIQAMVIVIIFSALLKLAKKQYKPGKWLVMLIVLTSLAGLGLQPWLIILIGGAFYLPFNKTVSSIAPITLLATTTTIPTTSSIFWVFLKIGSILFGSGYVLIAYLETMLIHDLGWLNQQQLLDAVALGQLTPGPVLSTATFIGYILNGNMGALAATAGIFLPAFILVSFFGPVIKKLGDKAWFKQFLIGVNIAALAVFVMAMLKMSIPVVMNITQLVILILGLVLHFKFKLGALQLLLAGLAIGLLMIPFS